MEKRGQYGGQYRGTNYGMIWFLVNLIVGAYLILKGLNVINFSFITNSIENIIIIVGGALIIISGFMSMRNSSSMQRFR
jgi:hypothetical protein